MITYPQPGRAATAFLAVVTYSGLAGLAWVLLIAIGIGVLRLSGNW
jgi:hypothetical protein